jgi:Holliday junction DNA helicase RuvA
MLALVRGIVRHKVPFTLVLDAGGVGYEILCTQAAYEKAPTIGNEYEVLTRLIVREDSLTLFGFAGMDERTIFDQVIAVSGIGPKTGLAIVSAIGPTELREAIRTSDIPRLVHIPNVGRKTAERMIVELRDKLLKEELTSFDPGATTEGPAKLRSDAIQALISLGYPRAIAEKAIQSVLRSDPEAGKELQSLIRAALKQAG